MFSGENLENVPLSAHIQELENIDLGKWRWDVVTSRVLSHCIWAGSAKGKTQKQPNFSLCTHRGPTATASVLPVAQSTPLRVLQRNIVVVFPLVYNPTEWLTTICIHRSACNQDTLFLSISPYHRFWNAPLSCCCGSCLRTRYLDFRFFLHICIGYRFVVFVSLNLDGCSIGSGKNLQISFGVIWDFHKCGCSLLQYSPSKPYRISVDQFDWNYLDLDRK